MSKPPQHPLNDSPSLPATLEAILDAVAVPVPAATLRALAGVSLRDRAVSAQALGRVGAYEQESFLRRGGAPRFSWVLQPNGVAASPRIWARGSWRLSRRILSEDAVMGWSVVLAMFLAEQMTGEDDWTRSALSKVAMEAAARVLGPIALYPPGTREEWLELRRKLAPHQHPMGPGSTTGAQDAAARALEGHGLTEFSLFFGVREVDAAAGEELPPRLRIDRGNEGGTPFEVLVMNKAAGNERLGRDVVAYIQEWGWLADRLSRAPSFEEYAEQWKVDLATVRGRNDQFARLFVTEETPERIWNLLWSGEMQRSIVRLMGRLVVESDRPPTVINHFVNCLISELRGQGELLSEVAMRIATFEEREAPPPRREMRRFFALCERARIWSAQVLVGAGEPELAEGLLSIESVLENASAAYAEQALGHYRRQLPKGPGRELLLGTQKALRIAATLDALAPPPNATPYLQGVEWAAKALAKAAAKELRQLNLIGEARATVKALEWVR